LSDSSDSSPENKTILGEPKPINNLVGCVLDINHIITCLYKFSNAIRNPAPTDKLRMYSEIDVTHFEYFDQQHVKEKFPGAAEFLLERLSRANTRRRQILKYHDERRAPLFDFPPPTGSDAERTRLSSEAVFSAEDGQGEVTVPRDCVGGSGVLATSVRTPGTIAGTTTITDTIASVVYVRGEQDNTDSRSDTDHSQTSYGPSDAGDSEIFRVPSPPDRDSAYNHELFQCPYCYSMITVTAEYSWM